MANNSSKTLRIYSSGLKRPRYFDRQQLRAADLALEQQYQSTRSRQLNRHLHGWGVVGGALLEQGEAGVSLSEGFAVTPLGDALHIPAIADIDLTELVENSCCGKPGSDCEDLSPLAEREDGSAATRRVYLAARPAVLPADPRTGVPEDCGHPGNHLEYSRECDAVSLMIVCELAPPQLPEELQCERWRELFCPESRSTDYASLLEALLPFPAEVSEESNYVVLATLDLVFARAEGQNVVGIEAVSYGERRLLLPTQLLQRYLSCFCSVPAPTPSPTPTPTSAPTPTPSPTVTGTQRPVTLTPTFTATMTLRPTETVRPTATIRPTMTLRPTVFTREPNTRAPFPDIVDLDIREYDTVLGRETSIDTLAGLNPEHNSRLRGMGIDSVAMLYATDTVVLAEELQISEVQVAELKDNALTRMKRVEAIALDETRFDIRKGAAMKPEEVHDIGVIRATILRNNGYSSVADVANAEPAKLAGILSVSDNQARVMINDARARIKR